MTKRLIDLTTLEDGWADGHGFRTQFSALDAAREVVRAFHEASYSAPAIFPTVEGGVLLEWASPDKVVNTEITPDGVFQLFALTVRDRSVSEDEIPDPAAAVAFLMRELSE